MRSATARSAFASLAVLVVLAACQRSVQTYPGAERAARGVATILPENTFNRARQAPFGASSADSEVHVRIAGQRLGGTHNSFSVVPGPQELQVVFVEEPPQLNGRQLVTQSVVLRIVAEAGHTYAIRGRSTWASGKPSVTLWAFDGTAGKTVASLVVAQARTKIVGYEPWAGFDADE